MTRTELHREWFHHYIDLWIPIHNLYGFDFPPFEHYCKDYDEWSNRLNKRPYRHIYYLNDKNQLTTDFCAGMRPPKGNWVFYYDYNSYKGKMFNISKRVFNPSYAFNILIAGEPRNIHFQI